MFLIFLQAVSALAVGLCVANGLRGALRWYRARAVLMPSLSQTVGQWPGGLQQLAPLVHLILPVIAGFVRSSPRLANELRIAGFSPAFDDQQFSAYRWVMGTLIALVMSMVCAAMLAFKIISPVQALLLVLVAATAGYLLPLTRLRERSQACRRQVLRSFPAFLDVLALTLESGQHLASALSLAADRLPETRGSPGLRHQIQAVLAEIRSGQSRITALQRFADRMALPEVTQFVASVSTADRQGVSVTELLRRQSRQIRLSRALSAERHAMKLPVKLLAPLAICIFPCTFLVIAFPIAVRLSESGLF
jgi:tight adherence protein C